MTERAISPAASLTWWLSGSIFKSSAEASLSEIKDLSVLTLSMSAFAILWPLINTLALTLEVL